MLAHASDPPIDHRDIGERECSDDQGQDIGRRGTDANVERRREAALIAVNDEASRRAIDFHVVQRPAPGVVRGVATSPAAGLPRGSTILSSGRHTKTPPDPAEFAEFVR